MVAMSQRSEPISLDRSKGWWYVSANGATWTFRRRRDAKAWRKTLYRLLRRSPADLLAEILFGAFPGRGPKT